MNVTQKQIAERLGVSQSLVAQALRGYSRVSDESRRKVEQAARELGYGANTSSGRVVSDASRGGRPRTHAIAVLLGEFFDGIPLHEVPFYKPILQGLKAEAAAREIDLSFFSTDTHRLPRVLTEGGVDGAICLYSDRLTMVMEQTVVCPVLRVGDGQPQDWTLRPDDERGIYLATRHLVEKGHRRIAYLGDFVGTRTHNVMCKSRLEGYLGALGDAGIGVHNELIESHIGGPQLKLGADGMARLLKRTRDFSAVVCFNDTSALGAIGELQRQGFDVPGDISVTGFDDIRDLQSGAVALSTVFFDRVEMGKRAVQLMCDRAEADAEIGNISASRHELLPVRLVERTSTAMPPAP